MLLVKATMSINQIDQSFSQNKNQATVSANESIA